MKKIVFLFSIFLFSQVHEITASTTQTYVFDDYEIRMTYTSDESSNKGYEIVKLGSNPFSTMLMYEDCWLRINDVIEIEGNHVFYGYIHNENNPTFYEGFILVLSPSGEELQKLIFDYELLESVDYMFPMDGVITIVVTTQTTDERQSYLFDHYAILTLDYEYEVINQVDVYQEYQSFDATDYLLLIHQDYDADYDIAYTRDLQLLDENDPLPIASNQVFTDNIYIPFLNEAIFNNQVVSNGLLVEYPGNYRLTYQEFTYLFKVEPSITGIEHNMVYNHSVTPIISSGNVYLNDDLFVSGTTITDPGIYNLKVIGLYGYEEVVQFTITSNVTGVIHNQTYQEPVEISFSGIGYLNNSFVTSPHTISSPGEYIFKVAGENDYTETYYFTIDEPIKKQTLVDFIQQYDLILLGVTIIGGLLVLKKK